MKQIITYLFFTLLIAPLFQLNGQNLALNKPINASSTESNSFPAQDANDGNMATRWSSSFSDAQWIYVDLQGVYSVERVVVNWDPAFAREYSLQVSTNLTNWQSLASVVRNSSERNEVKGNAPITGRYVRLLMGYRATTWGYSIKELEVYAKAFLPIGQTITLRGSNNLYVTGQDGTVPLWCDKNVDGVWEKFVVVDAGEGKVALKSMSKFLSSENGSESGVTCSRTSIDDWEKFDWIQISSNQVVLRGSNGRYISSENGLSVMKCNRTNYADWEIFNYVTTTAIRQNINEAVELSEISYYPNPVNDKFVYKISSYSKNHHIAIKDSSGKMIIDRINDSCFGSNTMDMSGLKAGVYFITITDKYPRKTFKIQKQ